MRLVGVVLGLMFLCAMVSGATFTMQVKNSSTGGYVAMDGANTVFRGDTVKFTADAASPDYDWGFGDGFGSNASSPEHRYTFGKPPILMNGGYKDITASLTTVAGGTDTETIRFRTLMQPLVTQSTNLTLMNENLSENFTKALTGNRTAPAGWAGFDWVGGIGATADVYESVLGTSLFLIIVFAIPFLMNWIISKDFVVSSIIGGFLGIYIITRLPANMQLLALMFIVMSIVALLYSLLKERV